MKNLLILTLFVWSSLAFPVCSSQISRTNSSALSVLTATKYNTDLNTVYSRVNELPGDCIESESVTTTQIDDGTIVNADISASAAVSRGKLAVNYTIAASNSASYTNSTTSYTDVTNQSVSITTTGGPVEITLTEGMVYTSGSVALEGCTGYVKAVRGSTDLSFYFFGTITGSTTCLTNIPASSLRWVDFPSAGTYTYKIQAKANAASVTTGLTNVKIMAREL